MIYKISVFFLIPMMLLALFLSLAGVQQIQMGNDYYNFIGGVARSFNTWKLEIPEIPNVPSIQGGDYDKTGLILTVLIKIANFFVFVVNSLVLLLNLIISIINILVQIVQFILTLIWRCSDFITGIAPVVA